MRFAISRAVSLVPTSLLLRRLCRDPASLMVVVCTEAPAMAARKFKHCLVASVFPAPDSPEIKRLWLRPNAHILW